MCSTWQSIGLWGLSLLTFLLGLGVGSMGGWHAHTAHGWGKRMAVHARHLGPAVKLAGGALVGLVVIGILAYGWLVK